jgi:hypothetical protein
LALGCFVGKKYLSGAQQILSESWGWNNNFATTIVWKTTSVLSRSRWWNIGFVAAAARKRSSVLSESWHWNIGFPATPVRETVSVLGVGMEYWFCCGGSSENDLGFEGKSAVKYWSLSDDYSGNDRGFGRKSLSNIGFAGDGCTEKRLSFE